MKTKKRAGHFVFLVLMLGLSGIVFRGCSREPWYHCQPLSAWLAAYDGGPRDYQPSPGTDNALRRIGAGAVPYLLELLRTTNSYSATRLVRNNNSTASVSGGFFAPPPAGAKEYFMTWLGKFPFRIRRVTTPPSWEHWKAYVAFQVLGPLGRSAIPELGLLAHDDPKGISFNGNIGGMKNIALIAGSADNSSTYVAPGDDASFHGSSLRRSSHPFLVDGEIAAWSLAAIGADAVPSLMELLNSSSAHLRLRAMEALGMVGVAAEPAIPMLLKNLQDSDLEIRQRAADALGWIGRQPDLVVPALIKALNDPDSGVKCYAADSLGHFGSCATNAIPVLMENFAERDYRIRDSAATALSKISPEITAKEIVPALFRQLEAPDTWHNGALMELLQLNLEPGVLIPYLIKALDDSDGRDKSIQVNAINALGKFGMASQLAVPRLISFTTDKNFENSWLREAATNALDKLIRHGEPAID
jgi:hypothetical protein